MMTNREFIQMVVSERIHTLLGRKMTPRESQILDSGEQVFRELDEGQRAKVEEYMDQMAGMEAAAEEKAYMGGVRDGVCLVLDIFKIWWEQDPGGREATANADVLNNIKQGRMGR